MFLHLLFFLTVIGAFMNTYLFNPTKDKFYAVMLMRMNAREYALTDYTYAILKVIVGFRSVQRGAAVDLPSDPVFCRRRQAADRDGHPAPL